MTATLCLVGCGASSGPHADQRSAKRMEQALMHIGLSAEKAQQHRYAASIFKRALRLNPQSPVLQRHLGYNYAAAGEYMKSITIYRQLAKTHKDPVIQLRIAQNHLALQHYFPALHVYQRILKQTTGSEPLAYNGLGIILDRLGTYHLAQRCYKKGLRQHPEQSSITNNLLMSQALSGQLTDAVERMQRLLVERSSPRIQANHQLLEEALVLHSDKKVALPALRHYLRERLFSQEKPLSKPLFRSLRKQATQTAKHWCS
tara:strand:+ start:93 stop:869 length:777 start_codon:yes stop_codon:yes gene_type:complete